MTSNEVILLVLTGQQTKQSVDKVYAELSDAIQQLHDKKKAALILTDIDHMVHSPKAEEAAKEALTIMALPFDAMAICYGTSSFVKLAQTLAAKAGRKDRVRTFASAKDASRWLAGFMGQQPIQVQGAKNQTS